MAQRIRLFELAYACNLYSSLTSYDRSLARLRERTGDRVDPMNPAHQPALFEWLNAWGCRQFAVEHHASTATPSLRRWARDWIERLPDPAIPLWRLSGQELDAYVAAYDTLRGATASHRRMPNGTEAIVTFGPTGSAKTLFAIRPFAVPPWDDPIRLRLGFGGDATSFRKYLRHVSDQLDDLAEEAQAQISELPALVGRKDSTPPKLIDEYNWVVYTRGMQPPSADTLQAWADSAGIRPPIA